MSLANDLLQAALTDGGVTLVRDTGLPHTGQGYVVGGLCHGITVSVDNVDSTGLSRTQEWIDGLPVSVAWVGSWKDQDTIYLDAVDIVQNRAAAVKLGRRRGELAIYDLSAGEEIRL